MTASPLLVLLACRGSTDLDSAQDSVATTASHTGDSASTDSGDTWRAGGVTVVEQGVVTCASPELRASGPMELTSGGPDWEQQAAFVDPGSVEYGQGVVVADFDGDGRLDILLPNVGQDELFLGTAEGTYRRVEGRLPENGDRTEAASAADVDDDGDLDVLAVNRGEPNAIWLNDGTGTFTAKEDAGLQQERFGSIGSTWGDVNGDGVLDLFIGAHFSRARQEDTGEEVPAAPPNEEGNPLGVGDPNEFYLGVGDGSFVDRGDVMRPHMMRGYTFAPGLHDLDLDGDLDLYLVNDFGTFAIPNVLLRNDAADQEPVWTDISESSGTGKALQGMGLGVGDVNGDGLPDMLVSSWSEMALFESAPDGVYVDTALSRGLSLGENDRYVAWGTELADVDNDGRLDAIVAFGMAPGLGENPPGTNPEEQPDGLWLQDEDGRFVQVADDWDLGDGFIGMGFAAVDLNGDGFLDLVKRFLDAPARIYLARCDERAWLRVRLHQPAPNVDAVGARLEVQAGELSLTRTIQIGGTNLSSSILPEAHFGLGSEPLVDRLVITWPDGEQSIVQDLATSQQVDIHR